MEKKVSNLGMKSMCMNPGGKERVFHPFSNAVQYESCHVSQFVFLCLTGMEV